jgi:hypothetical protein
VVYRERIIMSVVAFDSKEFIRGGEKSFFAPLGAGVKFDNEAEFKDNYNASLDETARKFRFDRKRKAYTTYELIQKLGFRKTIAFLEAFFQEIKETIAQMGVYYTIIPPTKVPAVKKYGTEGYAVQEVGTLKFLRELNPYYVYCCAWCYAQARAHPSEKLVLDGFEGKITNAWRELERIGGERLRVYLRGDQCNPFISTADMMAALVDFRLYRHRKRLDPAGITSVFSNAGFEVTPVFIGQPHLPKITPAPDRMIDVAPYFARPMIFIVPEELELLKVGAVRKILEGSPLMDSILNKAFEIDGAVKFFEPNIDSTAIRGGDKFVCLGPKAKAAAEYIQKMYDIEIWAREDFETIEKI